LCPSPDLISINSNNKNELRRVAIMGERIMHIGYWWQKPEGKKH
jgi:hypothetical protein